MIAELNSDMIKQLTTLPKGVVKVLKAKSKLRETIESLEWKDVSEEEKEKLAIKAYKDIAF